MRKPLILCLFLGLAACGFHLRTMVDIPKRLTNIAIISKDSDIEFIPLMKSQLQGYKLTIIPDPAAADYWLIINSILYQKQIINVGSSTNPRQFHLILTIDFSLQEHNGDLLLEHKQVVASRQLTVNNDRILGSNDEERLLRYEMKQDAVVQMINRLASIE